MKHLIIIPTILIALFVLVLPALAQDPFGGGISIPLDYGELIATMGEQNDSVQGWMFDWMTSPDSLIKIGGAAFPDGYQCGEDRDFAAADFNGDGMEELVYAWNRSDGGVFIGIPAYDLITMEPVGWNIPEPPIAAGVLYATDTLANILGEIRVVAGYFYDDETYEFVLAYLAMDSTVTIVVYDVDTISLVPEAKGSISDQPINTALPEIQKFGTASRFDVATGDLDNDGTDEIVLIVNDPPPSPEPETNMLIVIYDYDSLTHSIERKMQHSWWDNDHYTEVKCLRRALVVTGNFDEDSLDEVATMTDWAQNGQDLKHYVYSRIFGFNSTMTESVENYDFPFDYGAGYGVAEWNPVTSLNHNVHSLSVYNGDLIAGGAFSHEYGGSLDLLRIARWDGADWRPLGPGFNDYVNALTEYNGDLIAGGNFTNAGGTTVNHIARWDGSEWQPLGSGPNDVVYALTVYNGNLIVGGLFTNAGGVSSERIARWDGSEWYEMTSSCNGRVLALEVYRDTLIVGGRFTTINGTTVNYIARWDGSDWYPMGTGASWDVHALEVYNDCIYAAGKFASMNGESVNRIAKWDGSQWYPVGLGFNDPVSSLTTFNMGSYGEVLAAGGLFGGYDDPDHFIRAAWLDTANGEEHWRPFDTISSGPNDDVRAMIEHDGDLIMGGLFGSWVRLYQLPGQEVGYDRAVCRIRPEEDGVYDSLVARCDFPSDIVAADIDHEFGSTDELIVMYYSSATYAGKKPYQSLGIASFDTVNDLIYGRGNATLAGSNWGQDGLFGSRHVLAVADITGDEPAGDGIKPDEAVVLVCDSNTFFLKAFEMHPDSLYDWSRSAPLIASYELLEDEATELIPANLDTATIELRTPNYYSIDSIIQPLVVLNVPPVHYDIIDDTVWDLSGRYPWTGHDPDFETYCAYENSQIQTTSMYNEVRRDWGISRGLKTHFSAAGATVKTHLDIEFGEGFSVQGENTIKKEVKNTQTAHAEDQILATFVNYDVWEYPVYRRGERLVGGDVIVVDPTNVDIGWIVARDHESWISDHEVENVFSYPNYQNFEDNPMVATESVIEGYIYAMTGTSRGSFMLTQSEFGEATIEETSNFGIDVGASLGYEGGLNFFGFEMKWGFEVSVEGNYDRSELSTYTNSFTEEDVLHVIYGNINSASGEANRIYNITPYAYWAKNGALVLDYAASPMVGSQSEPTWWRNHYSNPDPAFILPWRYDPEKWGTQANENRYKTREIVFIPNVPSPGDSVLIIARVHNFSINPMPNGVQVAFYLGNPDNYGQLLYDKNTGDSLFYACDVDGLPTIIESQGQAAAQMVWQVPDEANISSCQRIWAYIDPLDSITPEVHDNDAEITNNKGWKRLEVNATEKCIDSDGDGYGDPAYVCHTCPGIDNCPDVYNDDQADGNGDGIGDACQWVCGDANGDQGVNVGDAVYLLNYVFRSGECATNPPIGCPPDYMSAGDANGDTNVNIGDVVYLNNFIFNPSQCATNPPIGCPPVCSP